MKREPLFNINFAFFLRHRFWAERLCRRYLQTGTSRTRKPSLILQRRLPVRIALGFRLFQRHFHPYFHLHPFTARQDFTALNPKSGTAGSPLFFPEHHPESHNRMESANVLLQSHIAFRQWFERTAKAGSDSYQVKGFSMESRTRMRPHHPPLSEPLSVFKFTKLHNRIIRHRIGTLGSAGSQPFGGFNPVVRTPAAENRKTSAESLRSYKPVMQGHTGSFDLKNQMDSLKNELEGLGRKIEQRLQAAPPPQLLAAADINQFGDQIYQLLEQKSRLARERRGL
ncbi:MAG: hypothetical protein WAN36_00690 [Calditrichia bacterium]